MAAHSRAAIILVIIYEKTFDMRYCGAAEFGGGLGAADVALGC